VPDSASRQADLHREILGMRKQAGERRFRHGGVDQSRPLDAVDRGRDLIRAWIFAKVARETENDARQLMLCRQVDLEPARSPSDRLQPMRREVTVGDCPRVVPR